MQWRWQSIQAAVPGALSEAEKLQHRVEQDLEDGEMPPLPSEEVLPSTSGTPEAQAAVRGDAVRVQQPTASAVGTPPLGLNEPSDSTSAPPLPAEQPPSAAAMTSASTAAAGQPAAAAAGSAAAAGGAAAAVDDDTDMEVDGETSPEASRPASAETAGPGAAEASGSLPNWAGFYMAHGYTYPYYGALRQLRLMLMPSYNAGVGCIFATYKVVLDAVQPGINRLLVKLTLKDVGFPFLFFPTGCCGLLLDQLPIMCCAC